MQNLTELMRRLIASQAEFVLVGGFAAVTHGSTLVTQDVDICCRFSEGNLMCIQKALDGLHPVHRSRPDMALDLTSEQIASLKNLYLKTDFGVLDCLSEVLGIGNFDEVSKNEVSKNSVELELPFGRCRVIGIDALIHAKQAMNRDHDKITVQHLLKIKAEQTKN